MGESAEISFGTEETLLRHLAHLGGVVVAGPSPVLDGVVEGTVGLGVGVADLTGLPLEHL